MRRGSIVYTDKFKIYDALMFCGYRHLKVDHGKHFSQGCVYINGLEGFWSWAKERLRLAIGLAHWLRPEGYLSGLAVGGLARWPARPGLRPEGFAEASAARTPRLKHHGVAPRTFPLYLKELEFRYNNRKNDIFTKIVQHLCDFVPNLE